MCKCRECGKETPLEDIEDFGRCLTCEKLALDTDTDESLDEEAD